MVWRGVQRGAMTSSAKCATDRAGTRTMVRPRRPQSGGIFATMEVLWSPAQVETIEASLSGARAGDPTLLTVHGDPGAGKTSFLREVRRRATGFTVLRADGNRSHPLSVVALLSDCGALSGTSPPLDPFGAAQVMRKRLDAAQLTAPVVLMLDDFQWLTPDAAELVGHVLRRSEGDRLLVAIGH